MADPVFSIVIPCYNYGRYLPGCVESIQSQGVDYRILVIDDASTDETEDVAQRLVLDDPLIEYRRHAENRGHIATYNEGLLEWADAKYSLLLSADDLLAPGALVRAMEVLERHNSVGLVYGRACSFSTIPPTFNSGTTRHGRYVVTRGARWLDKRCAEAVNVVPTPTAVVRTRAQRAVGGYSAELPHAADLEMWLRFALQTDVAFVKNAYQALYRVHSSSMSQLTYRQALADIRERRAVFSHFFASNGRALADMGIAKERTFRALANEALRFACRAYEKGIASETPIAEIVEFARSCHPDLRGLPAYGALLRRQRLGEAVCHRSQIFVGTTIARRVRSELWWLRLRTQGG